MTRPSNPPTPAPKGDPAREKRLAEALRANLKRRKAQAAKPPTGEESDDR